MTIRTQVHHLITNTAAERPDTPALTSGSTTLTYAELSREVDTVGAALQQLGIDRGDRVAIYLDKRLENVSCIFGASAAGAVFVPLNPLLRPRQVGYILRDCSVRVLVTTADRYAQLAGELARIEALRHVVVLGAAPAAPAGVDHTVHLWDAFHERGALHGRVEPRCIDVDVAAILYTSGSTGGPKGVVLSHRNVIVGAESVSEYLANTADDTLLAVLPLSFDAGLSQLTTGFAVGAHVVLLNYLLPRDVVRACAKYRVTGLTCVPPLWIQIVEQDWPAEVAGNLRYFANTGGRMPRATLDRLRSIFTKASPFLMYGLTEAFRSTYLDPSEVDNRPASIGKAIPNAEILVVRPDGTECAPEEEGELVHRGALVALGYWNDPERTAQRFKDAPGRPSGIPTSERAVWSGDAVKRDADGFLYFVGRKDEMIKTSGYRVSPTEVEEVAYETGVVRDAVALGVDDAALGQALVLVVTPNGQADVDEESLLAQLRQQLPLYMLPRRIIVQDEIPRSPNGKFDRNLLRQEVSA